MPVMADHFAEIDGKPHRVRDGAVNLGLAVDVEKKDGSRTLMVPVIRDAGHGLRFDASSRPTTRWSRRRARTR
jgi:pyruvate/2-oxoglutarate dehydrogenase complex dihydrolipoamide acyltransferase (E2) component